VSALTLSSPQSTLGKDRIECEKIGKHFPVLVIVFEAVRLGRDMDGAISGANFSGLGNWVLWFAGFELC
jgi:hypothetical protein